MSEVRSSCRTSAPTGIVPLSVLLLAVPGFAAATAPSQAAPGAENPDHETYILPPPDVQDLFATDKHYATLDYMSPDGDHFLVPAATELSTLELMAKPTYRLGELEVRPGTDRLWHLDTYGIHAFRFYSLSRRTFIETGLPGATFASDFTWSPDGSRIAFLAHLPEGTEVWTAEAATGQTRRLSDARILATLGTGAQGQGTRPSRMIQWTPEGTVLTLIVPPDRGPEPVQPALPQGPLTRRTRPEPTGTPTYPYLLEDTHDETLFEHYTRSQLAELSEGRPPVLLGPPRMYKSISLSTDGRHVLATHVERPFSFITSYRSFPSRTVIIARDGTLVATLDEEPLEEARTRDRDAETGPRSFAWRPDGAGLGFLERPAPESDGEEPELLPDRIMLLEPPFEPGTARLVAESEDPIESVVYSYDGRLVFADIERDAQSGIAYWDLTSPDPVRELLVDFHGTEDPTELPGELVTLETPNGLDRAMLSSDRTSVFLEGRGYRPDFRPRPFFDRIRLEDSVRTRLFEGSPDAFEQPLVPLDPDADRMIVSRESVTDFPDSYLWSNGEWGENLTGNTDPFPEITAARRIDFDFELPDGTVAQGRVSMPVGWREGDGPVPAVFWTYPREYEEAHEYGHAAIRARNLNAFTHLSWLRWSDIWLTQGYALVYPDIPVIGENYNDTYISSLLGAMYGAIRAVDGLGLVDIDRIGHGGHSYGAFATANVLANAPYFRAGIAGDGAYNRTLTPDGFQAERRSIWDAPQTYFEMSPFFRADQIDAPLLLYHGGDDNNTGTFPIQSRRMISALTILGKTAVLYEYPFESHTPRAIENKLDMWARFIDWFDTHVKTRGEEPASVSEDRG